MIEAEIYLNSWVCFDKMGLAQKGQITGKQTIDLIPFAEVMMCELKLSPIGYSEKETIETPTNRIKQMIIMAELEWYEKDKSYLTEEGLKWALDLLNKLDHENVGTLNIQ